MTDEPDGPDVVVSSDAMAMLDIAPDAAVIVDADGVVVFANQRVADVFGWEPGDLVGEPVDVLVPDTTRDRHGDHIASFHESPRVREMGADTELSARHADGTEIPVEISLAPLDRETRLVMATVRDVSDRRAISDALAAALEHERAAAEELRRASKLLDEFLEMAAHELRTPLASVHGFAETLLTHWDSQDDAWRRDMAERIMRNASTTIELTDRLLDVSALRSGTLRTRAAPVDVAALVRDTVVELDDLSDRDVRVTITAAGTIRTDRTAVAHVVTNLLTNAAKYSDAPAPIRVEVHMVEDGVAVTVTDEGVGIAADDLERVFEHGYRGERTPALRGRGIGLNVARQYAEAVGGHLEATSEVGAGSTFRALFPDTA